MKERQNILNEDEEEEERGTGKMADCISKGDAYLQRRLLPASLIHPRHLGSWVSIKIQNETMKFKRIPAVL